MITFRVGEKVIAYDLAFKWGGGHIVSLVLPPNAVARLQEQTGKVVSVAGEDGETSYASELSIKSIHILAKDAPVDWIAIQVLFELPEVEDLIEQAIEDLNE